MENSKKPYSEILNERRLLEELYLRQQQSSASSRAPGLMEFIPQLNKKYMKPMHLKPLILAMEEAVKRAQGNDISTMQVVCSTPPRHGKSESLLAAISWGLMLRPELTFGYVTYNDSLAASKSRKAQMMAVQCGVELATTNVAEWRTTAGGGLLAAGIMGTWTGHGVDIAIVDDPTKSRLEAESTTYRNRVWDQFADVVCTRIEPGGSVIVNMARWHPDDLAGRLVREEGDKWRQVIMPAISDDGKALWPERWPVELLNERRERVGEYTWASLFQGRPRPRGGALFGEPHVYSTLPTSGFKRAIGIDLAYAAKTSSDWSVLVSALVHGGKVYITDVVRMQAKAPEFKERVASVFERYGKPVVRWYAYGSERGIGDFLSDKPNPIPVEIVQAPGDHFIRAQPLAAAWNRGDVLVPERAPWLDDFLSEVCSFTGVNDDHDDQVDAACACFDVLAPDLDKPAPRIIIPGSDEWHQEESKRMRQWAMREVQAREERRNSIIRDFGFDPNDSGSIF